MTRPGNCRCQLLPVVAVLSIGLAFLTSGCLWGVVRDADTGAAPPGVTVSYADSEGHTGSTTTDANGIYAFDIATGPVPTAGAVSFELSRMDYQPLTAARLVEYNDNPKASGADLSSFWEVQHFNLVSSATKIVEVDLKGVDIGKAKLAPSVLGSSTQYFVVFRAYSWDSFTTPACEQTSGWFPVPSTDPPSESLNFSCSVPGDTFRATVTVIVERTWPSGTGVLAENDVSTAEWSWTAPGPDPTWAYGLVDSTDTAGPDDPDLAFQAQIRYRALTLVPLAGP
jgi:hypothetical protein